MMIHWPVSTWGVLLVFLAQGGAVQRSMTQVLWWGGALLIVSLILGGLVLTLRRKIFSGNESGTQIFSLHDLRRMKNAGEISDEEFETLRARVVAELGGAAEGGEADTRNGPDRSGA